MDGPLQPLKAQIYDRTNDLDASHTKDLSQSDEQILAPVTVVARNAFTRHNQEAATMETKNSSELQTHALQRNRVE